MATRDELYAKFGITAEAAQLFETELGTLLLGATALGEGWHVQSNSEAARKLLADIDRSTMGALLSLVKVRLNLTDDLDKLFSSALSARNRLSHGFFEKHNFRIQSDDGRDLMIADLELLHDELFKAWRAAGTLTSALVPAITGFDIRVGEKE